jgi:hypothetical protein
MYGVGPDGLCGNDDMGQMSAWYIFSAMGFYPVSPGQNVFVIGTPLFEEIRLKFDDFFESKEFVVKAEGVSSENIFIQSAMLNDLLKNAGLLVILAGVIILGIVVFSGSQTNAYLSLSLTLVIIGLLGHIVINKLVD